MKPPLISVVIPVYNAEQYLAPAVRSILNQTERNFELIAVDDGSTDCSLAVLRDADKSDYRVRVISRPNTGIVGALNDGLVAARGEYIARMDSDDVSLPNRFARQIAFLQNHPECVAVGATVTVVDPGGWPLWLYSPPETHNEIEAYHFQAKGGGLVHPSVMIRRETVLRVGGYRKEFEWAEDYDLWLRLAEVGRLHNLRETLLYYRLHGQNVSTTKAAQQRLICWKVLEAALERRQLSRDLLTPPPENNLSDETSSDFAAHRTWWVKEAMRAGYYNTARKHALLLLAQKKNWASAKLFLSTLPGSYSKSALRSYDWLMGRQQRQ